MAGSEVVPVVVGTISHQQDEEGGGIPVVDGVVDEAANRHGVEEATGKLVVDVLAVGHMRRQRRAEAIVGRPPGGQPLGCLAKFLVGYDDVLGSVVTRFQSRERFPLDRCRTLPAVVVNGQEQGR